MSRHGQLKTFVVRPSKASQKGKRGIHVTCNTVGPGSRRTGQINLASFAWFLPEPLARELYEGLGRALDDLEHGDDREMTSLPGAEDVS